MVDNLDPEQRQRAMRSVRSRDTAPEVQLRRALHATGLRFRIHRSDLPGSPDIVFPKYQAVVFVHGCFWHGHVNCLRAKLPTTSVEYWLSKRVRNQKRDAEAIQKLRRMGWRVKVIWTCRLANPSRTAAAIDRWLCVS